jgi:hypothetical protein
MKRAGFSPSGELGDDVDFPEQLAHHLTGVVALAQLVELANDPPERILGLGDGHFRVVLALLLEATMMLQEFFTEEVCEALAGRPTERLGLWKNVDMRQTILEVHAKGTLAVYQDFKAFFNRSLMSLGLAFP